MQLSIFFDIIYEYEKEVLIMANYQDLANLIFPEITDTVEDLERRYPSRNLPEGAMVTRFAPSPTGFLHTGSLFTSLVSNRFAKQSGGVFYLRNDISKYIRFLKRKTNLTEISKYYEKCKLSEPKRCPNCRQKRKENAKKKRAKMRLFLFIWYCSNYFLFGSSLMPKI